MCQIEIRTIGAGLGKSTRSSQSNYRHIGEQLRELESKGFLEIGEKTRAGTLYVVKLPGDVPAVQEQIAASVEAEEPVGEHFKDPILRRQLFERDKWTCRYCGDAVSPDTAALDHVIPISAGGTNEPGNLAACCLMCNSIKSGRTYEEAAAQLLADVRRRRSARNAS